MNYVITGNVETLQDNPVATVVIFYDDMYVETGFSQEAADTIKNVRIWVTNEYEHNAIRTDGERVLDRLIQILRGDI